MATNLWDHPQVLAAEALTHLEDALVVSKMCAMDKTSEFTTQSNGWKVGDTISFRTHGDYEVKEFTSTISTQPIQSSRRSMTIEKHFDVSVELTSRELALDLDSFTEQVLQPAAYRLAEKIDKYVSAKLHQAFGLYTSTALFDTVGDVAQARNAATIQQLSPNRFCLVDLQTDATLMGQEWFNRADSRGQAGVNSLQSGVMGYTMGMNFYSSLGFPTLALAAQGDGTTTTVAADPTKNQIGQSTLSVAATTGTFKVGDRIMVAGMRRPMVIKTQANATATSLVLVDPINELVPPSAAVTVLAAGKTVDIHGAIFDDRSLAVAFPKLDVPPGGVVQSNNGINIRLVKDYNISTKVTTMSMDILVGAFCLDPRRVTLLGQRSA